MMEKEICDVCQNDITPECKVAKDDGYEEGFRAALDVIRSLFIEREINRDDVKKLDMDKAQELLKAIHYTINY